MNATSLVETSSPKGLERGLLQVTATVTKITALHEEGDHLPQQAIVRRIVVTTTVPREEEGENEIGPVAPVLNESVDVDQTVVTKMTNPPLDVTQRDGDLQGRGRAMIAEITPEEADIVVPVRTTRVD